MKKYKKIILSIFLCFAIINFSGYLVFAEGITNVVLNAAKETVKQYYLEKVPSDTLASITDMDSLVKALRDPYSAYFTAKQYADFTDSINNSFSGIGIQIDADFAGIKVVSVYDNTPAMEQGLKAGDVIIKADEHSLTGVSIEESTSYIKGPAGTSVSLQVKRGESILNFKVLRKAIVLPTVENSVLDKHIGYLKVTSFGENTSTEFKNGLAVLKKASVDSYIVDLRNNGGGYMNVAFDLAGYFIGNHVAINTQSKSETFTSYNATDQKEIINKPVIFLTNGYSASASEILSAAVKDYKKAFFIGEKTYGKGVAQSIFTLPDNSYIKLTVFKFVSPLGKEINKVGISPDLEVKDDTKLGIDSLSAAKILFSDLSNKADESSLARVSFQGQNYNVDLNVAKDKYNINTFKYMETKYVITPTTVAKGTKNIQGLKVFASNKLLPDTGTAYDFYFYLGIGSTVFVAGIFIILRKNKKPSHKG